MASIDFTSILKTGSGHKDADSTSAISADAAAPFDPENPEQEIAAPTVDPEANLLQRGVYYFQLARYHKDQKLKSLRPWKDFADREEFSIPGKLEALSRVSDNIQYFQANYFFLVGLMSIYILITNLWFMVGMGLCGAMYYWVKMKAAAKEPIMIGSTELTATQSYFGLFLLSLLTFYATDGSSTVFWLVTCAGVVVLGHATCRKPIASNQNVNPAFSFA